MEVDTFLKIFATGVILFIKCFNLLLLLSNLAIKEGNHKSPAAKILITYDQALPLSLITQGEEGLKYSDGLHEKRTDSDLIS